MVNGDLVEFVGHQLGEDGRPLRGLYATVYDGHALPRLPWGDAEFDCVLVAADPHQTRKLASAFADEIVKHRIDWVETTGSNAEWVHDLVDEASVRAGMQEAVGDGRPMTAWHEDAITVEQMSDVARHSIGGCDFVLCLVIGGQSDFREFVECLWNKLRDEQ